MQCGISVVHLCGNANPRLPVKLANSSQMEEIN